MQADGVRVRLADGSITASGSVVSDATRLRTIIGQITASGLLSVETEKLFGTNIVIAASANVVTNADRQRVVSGAITAAGSLSVVVGTEQDFIAFIISTGEMSASAGRTTGGVANISANGNIVATLYKFGEEWVVVADETNSWTTIPDGSSTWTTQTSGTNSWQQIG